MSTIELHDRIHITHSKPVEKKKKIVVYPAEDGKPMAETPKHGNNILNTTHALRVHFVTRKDVYIAMDNFVYWREGFKKDRLAPDIYVVIGVEVDKENAPDSWLSWEHGGILPSVVFEFTSLSTKSKDEIIKPYIYEREMRTPEYFQFDPIGGLLYPRLQGRRLQNGYYVRIKEEENGIYSEQLGLYLQNVDGKLRLYDPAKKELLPTTMDSEERANEEARRANQEARRANQESQLRYEANLTAQKAILVAEEEARRANQEARRADALEAELQKLKALLGQNG